MFGFICSGDADMVNYKKKFIDGKEMPGTLKVDILSDEVMRVRYAEQKDVPLNQTPMLDCHLKGPKKCIIKIENIPYENALLVEGSKVKRISEIKKQAVIQTSKIRAVIEFEPYRVTITDLNGNKLCGISGSEKNHFGTWDNIGTSICRKLGGKEEPIAAESFDLAPDECIYGLGEKFLKLDKVGQTVDLFTQDGLGVFFSTLIQKCPIPRFQQRVWRLF
ncbi:DUF4968 domain-containing protein [Kamptonema cortianum]|nr:DUF4968 domain-containing protein [Kamptonema cortianum]